MFCPCGSSLRFSTCCQPFLQNQHSADNTPTTAEQLMRSRFSAYATKNAQYIIDTYGEKQKSQQSITDIQSWADECSWVALVIHESSENLVDFSAYYITHHANEGVAANNKAVLCELRERSTFALEQEQWRYIDGEISVNNEISDIKRNEICPCNHFATAWSAKKNKKFKHCCGKNLR